MRSILVVEGRNGARPVSDDESYQVETVGTCRDALERITLHPLPQVILVEMRSAEGNGIERLIRTSPLCKQLFTADSFAGPSGRPSTGVQFSVDECFQLGNPWIEPRSNCCIGG
jgi:hypothetical protein